MEWKRSCAGGLPMALATMAMIIAASRSLTPESSTSPVGAAAVAGRAALADGAAGAGAEAGASSGAEAAAAVGAEGLFLADDRDYDAHGRHGGDGHYGAVAARLGDGRRGHDAVQSKHFSVSSYWLARAGCPGQRCYRLRRPGPR